MMTLDELSAAHAAHLAKVAACSHVFTKESLGAYALGLACEHCGTHELVWLRGEGERLKAKLEEARGCIKMLVRCAVPNAREHPTMWDAWGDASEWLGEDRNRHRIPHAGLRGNARAGGRTDL